ncbi:DeoR/GlpR family DNA-binding transcription regulator [Arthrobacter sp. TMN-37]
MDLSSIPSASGAEQLVGTTVTGRAIGDPAHRRGDRGAPERTPRLHRGELLPKVYSLWGPSSVQQIQHLRVDVAIFGADTVDEQGIFNTSSCEIELKRTMRSISKEAFFVTDSSKFGREALFEVFDLDQFTAGITDNLLDPIRASHFPVPVITVNPRNDPGVWADRCAGCALYAPVRRCHH